MPAERARVDPPALLDYDRPGRPARPARRHGPAPRGRPGPGGGSAPRCRVSPPPGCARGAGHRTRSGESAQLSASSANSSAQQAAGYRQVSMQCKSRWRSPPSGASREARKRKRRTAHRRAGLHPRLSSSRALAFLAGSGHAPHAHALSLLRGRVLLFFRRRSRGRALRAAAARGAPPRAARAACAADAPLGCSGTRQPRGCAAAQRARARPRLA